MVNSPLKGTFNQSLMGDKQMRKKLEARNTFNSIIFDNLPFLNNTKVSPINSTNDFISSSKKLNIITDNSVFNKSTMQQTNDSTY